MRNSEKYKTVEERTDAFIAFCDRYKRCNNCPVFEVGNIIWVCALRWLELEAKESEDAK